MNDDNNQPSATSDQSSSTNVGGGGNLKKEMEPMPSGTDFSELSTPIEDNAEPEPEIEAHENTDSSPSSDDFSQNSRQKVEAKDSVRTDAQTSFAASGNKYPMTKQQAQKIVKGPLLFKNSSDPMLWLALLMLRHYQWLERQKK